MAEFVELNKRDIGSVENVEALDIDGSRVVDGPMLQTLNRLAVFSNLPHALPSELAETLDPEGKNLVSYERLHKRDTGTYVQCHCLLKLVGRTQPVDAMIDVWVWDFLRTPPARQADRALLTGSGRLAPLKYGAKQTSVEFLPRDWAPMLNDEGTLL